ncbi:hypothetical protein Tco_1458476 [Tanacetum coccineum]
MITRRHFFTVPGAFCNGVIDAKTTVEQQHINAELATHMMHDRGRLSNTAWVVDSQPLTEKRKQRRRIDSEERCLRFGSYHSGNFERRLQWSGRCQSTDLARSQDCEKSE